MPDVGFTGVQLLDLHRVDVEPNDGKTLFPEPQNQRQAHIAQSDDTYPRFVRLNLLDA